MKIFFDTEFIEDGKTIDLISIGMVREDGKTLYFGNHDTDWNRIYHHTWLMTHVVPQLPTMTDPDFWISKEELRNRILNFCGTSPEFWAYYASYDWVVLCQLFGTMMDLPKTWPMYCRDFKQLCDESQWAPEPQSEGEHNALQDARWLMQEYNATRERLGWEPSSDESAAENLRTNLEVLADGGPQEGPQ